MPSAAGARRRVATWATPSSASTTPRKGTTSAGSVAVRPRLASTYAPVVITAASRMRPSSVLRRTPHHGEPGAVVVVVFAVVVVVLGVLACAAFASCSRLFT